MKPIYMSANFEQVDAIKKLLSERGVVTALQAKEDSNNPLTPKGIIWFELWLKRQSDEEIAETVIEKFEIGQLRNSLKVSWKTPGTGTAKNSAAKPNGYLNDSSPSQNIPQGDYESWMPVNNQKVFHRLASTLNKFTEEPQSDTGRQAWNPETLKSQVQTLQQLCKMKSTIKTMSDN